MNYIAVNASEHLNYGFDSSKSLAFAKSFDFIEITSKEMYQFKCQLPLVFKKTSNQYAFGLLSGFNGTNLFVSPIKEAFVYPYVPAILRAYPYRLLRVDNKDVLCVLDSEKNFEAGQGQAVFDDKGKTEYADQLVQFLQQLNTSFEFNKRLVQLIVDLDLLKPWPLTINAQNVDGKKLEIKRDDLYVIDEKKLRALPAEQLKQLMDISALPMIYNHLFSLRSIDKFEKLVHQYFEIKKKATEQKQSIKSMFDDDESDLLRFE